VIPGYNIIKDSLGVLASKGLVFKSLGASLFSDKVCYATLRECFANANTRWRRGTANFVD